MEEPFSTHRKICPSRSFAIAARPCSKVSSCPRQTSSGDGASGFVSMAVMKIPSGSESMGGTLLKGRVRNEVHNPDSINKARTSSRLSPGMPLPLKLANEIFSSGAGSPARSLSVRSMTTDCKARLSPRWIPATTPAPGDVYTVPGDFLSSKRTSPRLILSPSRTAIVGFMPI